MKKYLLFLIAYSVLFSSLSAQHSVFAETATEVISASDTYELTKIVHELTDNAPVLYAVDSGSFPSNKIIVFSDSEFDYCGAEIAVNDSDGMYVLLYSTNTDAEKAYNELVKNPELDVIPDTVVSVPTGDDYDSAAFENTYDLTISSSHLSWGSDFIETDCFINTLYNNYGTVADMPKVTVAVIDTGVDYNHTFLSGRVIKGYDYVNSDTDPMDDHSHGTHVAGIVCDNTLANVEILAYKTLNASGNGSIIDTLAAMKSAKNNGADIINLSLGATDPSGNYFKMYSSQLNRFIKNGITIVTAAGNEKSSTDYVFPANMDNVITVSACASDGVFASTYSNFGETVDVCAPGTSVYSTVLNNKYARKSGTSMACPYTVAAAALLKTADPDLSPSQVEALLRDSAVPNSSDTDFDYYYGYGLLNLEALAEYYSDEEPTPTPEPESTPEPGLPALCSASVTDGGYITVNIVNQDNVLGNGKTAVVAGYKSGSLAKLITYAASEEGSNSFRFTEDKEIDVIKIFILESLDNPVTISKTYRLEKGESTQ